MQDSLPEATRFQFLQRCYDAILKAECLIDMAAALGESLKWWLAYHPRVTGFRWQRDETPAASYDFVLPAVFGYLVAVFILHNLLKLKQGPVPLSFIPALHYLVHAFGALVMFAGSLQSTLVEIEHSRWLWGPKSGRMLLLCFPPGTRPVGRVFFWSYVYHLSKYDQLVETIILILRKRPLTFLHVFRHATVIFVSFLWLESAMSLQIVALLTNTGIDVIRYTYYFLCSVGKPPAWKKIVTNSQILQLLFSLVASAGTLWFHFTTEEGCEGMSAWISNAVFNVSLLFLFLNFHKRQYRKDKPSQKEMEKED